MIVLWLRLAAATLVVLAPGWLVARALGRRGVAATLAWSLAVVAGALALTFAVHRSLDLTLGLVLGVGVVAIPFSRRQVTDCYLGRGATALAGLAFGIALWFIQGAIVGDALFHLGRVRKLDDFGSLSLRAVDEFKDGGLHPGYAFPLWHGWLALVAKVAAVDPATVVKHESSLLVPVAFMLAYELGYAVFRSRWLALGVTAAVVGTTALAAGDGGSYVTLALPATAARQLLVTAVLVLFFEFVREPSRGLGLTLAAASVSLALVHPTYALFVALPLVGFALARVLVTRGDVRRNALALAAFGTPVLLVFAWLAPIVSQTHSHNPNGSALTNGLTQYRTDLVVHSRSSYHLAPAIVGRTGAIAIAALVLTPLAGLAARRRWSALVLGGTVLVLAIELSSLVFPHFSDLVSLSQSRRAAGFVPFAFALVGGAAVLARLVPWLLLPGALAAGIALELAYPGDFGLHLRHGGPLAATWIALWGGIAALAVAAFLRPRIERTGALVGLAVLVFVAPVAVHGFSHWDTAMPRDPNALTPGLVRFLRRDVPERSVVFADLQTSYEMSAYAPVYVANGPPTHVADTKANRPYARRNDLDAFLRSGDLAIPRRYHAGWLVLRGRELAGKLALRQVYRDTRFVVFRL